MADIFREVDEEIRRDNAAKLWAKYGRYVVAAAVAVVVGTAAIVGWQEYRLSQREEQGARLADALELAKKGNRAAAINSLGEFAGEAGAGYGMLARLHEAALRSRSGDLPGAIQIYESVAADDSAPQRYRDLAVVLMVLYQIDDGDPAQLLARLEPLTGANSAWRFSALELSAMLERRAGNDKAAREILKTVTDDPQAPPGIRARAAEMLVILGGAPGAS